jgi:uncharacterized protein affecting Mg2+/Co2+ transport
MEYKKKIEKIKSFQKITLILAIIAFLIGGIITGRAELARADQKRAQAAANNLEISIIYKDNDSLYQNGSATFVFKFKVKNHSDANVSHITGDFKIMNTQGEVLSFGTVTFNRIQPDSETTYTLKWSVESADTVSNIWNSDFEQLGLSFEITTISLNGSIEEFDVSCSPVTKPSSAN